MRTEPSLLYLALEPSLRRFGAWARHPGGIVSMLAAGGAAVCLTFGVLQLTSPTAPLHAELQQVPRAAQQVASQLLGRPLGAAAVPGYPRILVPRVGINLLLVRGDGQTPPDVFEAFTYPGADHLLVGAAPGGGNSYVYAHAQNGMFWNLHDVRAGDLVEIDYGGGRLLTYRITQIHPSVSYRDFSWLQPTADDRLTLQTCNGWADTDPRFIVIAERIA